MSARLASLAELDTVLGPEDLYMLVEVHVVDNENRRLAEAANRKKD